MLRKVKKSLLVDRLKYLAYRNNASLFMEVECGLKPSPKQAEFLKAMENLDNQRALVCASANSGKTVLMAVLAVWSCTVLPYFLKRPYEVAILGGSGEQSKRAYRWVMRFIFNSEWIASKIKGEPKVERTDYIDGSSISMLKCSETSVRGVHPDCAILDEAASIPTPLAKAAIVRVDASPNPRLIMDSTPHIYYSLFVEYWFNSEKYNFKRYGWNSYDCPWIPKDRIDKRRGTLDDRTFKIEYLAEPTPLKTTLIEASEIADAIIADTRPELEGKMVLSIDWGREHPTAVSVWQKQGDFDVCLYSGERARTRFSEVQEWIKTLIEDRYTKMIDVIVADRSHIGENERLQEAGYYVVQIPFGPTKEAMKSYAQARFEKRRVRIPKSAEQLIKELQTYTDIGQKEKDDNVDSMLMALWELRDTDGEEAAELIGSGIRIGGISWQNGLSPQEKERHLRKT